MLNHRSRIQRPIHSTERRSSEQKNPEIFHPERKSYEMFVHRDLPLLLDLRLEPELEELDNVAPEASDLLGLESRDPSKLLLVSFLGSLDRL